jgi:hypothetical protein
MTPALLNRMSSRPKARTAASTAPRQSFDLDTSQRKNRALPPSFSMASKAFLPRCSSRAATTTEAPSAANSMAVASPIPELPPVTIATLLESFMDKHYTRG